MLAFFVFLSTGMARGTNETGMSQWVDTYIALPVTAVVVLFVVWLKKRNE